jgi:protein-tyrosine phosphatase
MFKILVVCTGNLCRSPYTERLLSRNAPAYVEITSAGTLDIPGVRSPKELLEIASDRGLDLKGHRSRSLSEVDAGQMDLVLGMTLDHVATSVVEANADATKSFTLTEFIRLIEAEDAGAANSPEQAKELIERAHRRRSETSAFVPAEDVADPMGGTLRAYKDMADKLDDLVKRMRSRFGWTAT